MRFSLASYSIRSAGEKPPYTCCCRARLCTLRSRMISERRSSNATSSGQFTDANITTLTFLVIIAVVRGVFGRKSRSSPLKRVSVAVRVGREHFAVAIHLPVKLRRGLCRATAKCSLPRIRKIGDFHPIQESEYTLVQKQSGGA